MKKALFLVMAAGATAAMANPTVEYTKAAKRPIRALVAQRVSDGATIVPGNGNDARGVVVPYDTVNSALAPGFTNWAKGPGAAYTTGAGGGYTARNFVTAGLVANSSPTFTFTSDNGTPTNPNDDVPILAITECIFDDFDFDQTIQAGDAYDRFTMNVIETTFAMNQAYATDDNGTPTNPNDDFPLTRNNTLNILYWGLNDNGTPTNANDDFIEFVDGVGLTFGFTGPTNFIYSMTPADLTGIGGVQVPGQGIVMHDWANTSNHFSGDNGAGVGFTGGDDRSDGTATGSDGVIIPPPEDCWTAAGTIISYGFVDPFPADAGWAWVPTAVPGLFDPGADGNPSDTTFTDLLLSAPGVDWSFGIPVGTNGNLGPGRYDLPENVGLAMSVEPAEVGCPADLTGSSDPNDPSYGVPDGDADADDFFYYLDQFVAGNLAEADLTGSSDPNDPSYGVPDGDADADDFFFYLDLFVVGCP